MSSQTEGPTAVAYPTAPVAAPAGPRERRLRFGHLALAVALMAVGALGTVALVTAVSTTGEYLALQRDMAANAELTADDLTVVRINTAPGLRPVAAKDLDRVVGLYAAIPLVEGTLLTAAQLTAQPLPGPGQQVLGITLGSDRLPATRPHHQAIGCCSWPPRREDPPPVTSHRILRAPGRPRSSRWSTRPQAVSSAGAAPRPSRSTSRWPLPTDRSWPPWPPLTGSSWS